MSREKQIEELATEIYTLFQSRLMSRALARHLYDKGWRKQSVEGRIEGVNPFIEDTIYPLTIIADRYNGTYSGGSFLAWNLDADVIPEGAQGYDGFDALDFWEDNKIPCGKGRTVSEAVLDLYVKMKGGE